MSMLLWIILGLIVGSLASRYMGVGRYGITGDFVVGVMGSLLGGRLATAFLGLDVTGLNLTSVAIGVLASIILLIVFRSVTPARRPLFRWPV